MASDAIWRGSISFDLVTVPIGLFAATDARDAREELAWRREHLAALEFYEHVLVLTTMRFAHEIRSPKDLGVSEAKGGSEKEMRLARELVETLSDDWDPHEYKDTYTEVLRQVIEAKVEGREVVTAETPERPRVPT